VGDRSALACVQRRSGGRLACRRAGHPARRNKLLKSSAYLQTAKNRSCFPGGKMPPSTAARMAAATLA